MNEKKYVTYRILIVIALSMTIGIFVSAGNYIIPLIAFVIAASLMYLVKRKVKGFVLSDERIEKISGKASRITYTITTMFMALGGMVLIAARERYPDYVSIGYTFSYLACLSMVIYIIAYGYYNKK